MDSRAAKPITVGRPNIVTRIDNGCLALGGLRSSQENELSKLQLKEWVLRA